MPELKAPRSGSRVVMVLNGGICCSRAWSTKCACLLSIAMPSGEKLLHAGSLDYFPYGCEVKATSSGNFDWECNNIFFLSALYIIK